MVTHYKRVAAGKVLEVIEMRTAQETSAEVRMPAAEPASDHSLPRPENWEDIELSFIGDHDLEIRIGDKVQKLNYKEIEGFEDRRNGMPSQLWAMVRVFGSFPDGTMPDDARHGEEWLAIQKKIERASNALRKHFGMTGDPFPYIPKAGYRARVKIRIASPPAR